MRLLARNTDEVSCNPASTSQTSSRKRKRRVVDVPLIARSVANDVYTRAGRSRVLSAVGVPAELHDAEETKILVVSFGGQSIPRPRSAPPSPARSLGRSPTSDMSRTISRDSQMSRTSSQTSTSPVEALQWTKAYQTNGSLSVPPVNEEGVIDQTRPRAPRLQRLMTQHHLYLPGAPPALHQPVPPPNASLLTKQLERLKTQDVDLLQRTDDFASPDGLDSNDDSQDSKYPEDEQDGLLPPQWIAVVCGLSGKEKDDSLPDGFYAAPRDVYMPDLTAVCDVLLGKLGYGTCSETVATQTPFVYGTFGYNDPTSRLKCIHSPSTTLRGGVWPEALDGERRHCSPDVSVRFRGWALVEADRAGLRTGQRQEDRSSSRGLAQAERGRRRYPGKHGDCPRSRAIHAGRNLSILVRQPLLLRASCA